MALHAIFDKRTKFALQRREHKQVNRYTLLILHNGLLCKNKNPYSVIDILKVTHQFQNVCIPGCLLIHLNIIIQQRQQSSIQF